VSAVVAYVLEDESGREGEEGLEGGFARAASLRWRLWRQRSVLHKVQPLQFIQTTNKGRKYAFVPIKPRGTARVDEGAVGGEQISRPRPHPPACVFSFFFYSFLLKATKKRRRNKDKKCRFPANLSSTRLFSAIFLLSCVFAIGWFWQVRLFW
jgi:hypothetical protein